MNRSILIVLGLVAGCFVQGQPKSDLSCQQVAIVYVCMGPMSKAYHCDPNCRGLKKCSTELKAVPVEKALSMGRHACGYCYK